MHACFRPIWEGGEYDGDESQRQDALRQAIELGSEFVDDDRAKGNLINYAILFCLTNPN